ncbi:MAG: DUF1634 domain-containing protein [Chloroflexota bacterium]
MSGPHAEVADTLSGRLLITFTYISVGLLVIGVALMIANGISPLAAAPTFDMSMLVASLVALQPEAFLWLGLAAIIAAPIGRVILAGAVYAVDRDVTMVVISVAILVVIAIGVGTAIAATV